jgi:hypothetical protein
MDLRELLGRGWTYLPPDRDQMRTIVTAIITAGAPYNARNLLSISVAMRFSRKILLYGVSYVVH